MRAILERVLTFHREPSNPRFADLAEGQRPEVLFVTCADSRVVPHVLLTSEPGDLFVMRNVGNLVPRCDESGLSRGDHSEAAAVEYAVEKLGVAEIIVCGHSNCGAMGAVLGGSLGVTTPNLARWIDEARAGLEAVDVEALVADGLAPPDRLSQRNVVGQLGHLRGYPVVREAEARGALCVHGWWFDIGAASVSAFDPALRRFVPIDAHYAARWMAAP